MTIVLFMKTDFKANAYFTILKNLPISNPSMKGVNFWKIMELVGRFPSNTCNTSRWYHHDGSVHSDDGKDDNWDDNTDEQNGSDHTICNLNESVCKTQEVNKVNQKPAGSHERAAQKFESCLVRKNALQLFLIHARFPQLCFCLLSCFTHHQSFSLGQEVGQQDLPRMMQK